MDKTQKHYQRVLTRKDFAERIASIGKMGRGADAQFIAANLAHSGFAASEITETITENIPDLPRDQVDEVVRDAIDRYKGSLIRGGRCGQPPRKRSRRRRAERPRTWWGSAYRTVEQERKDELRKREDRLRRMARKQGLQLQKSRRRNPDHVDYGTYRIRNPRTNGFAVRIGLNMRPELTLDQTEEWLTSRVRDQAAGARA